MANISQIKLPSGDTYGVRAPAIPYGEVDSTSTSTAFTATVPGISELVDGAIVMLKNGVVTSVTGFTINVNGLGAKPVYSSMATGYDTTAPTRDTSIFNHAYTMLFVYSTDLVDGGCWICYRGYDSNTNTIGYQLRTNSGNLTASDTGYRYRLWLTSADGTKWVPINTSTSTNATTARTLNTRPIDPFGSIVYNSTNGTVSSGARPSVTTIWQQYTLTIGYSYVKTLTAWNPVFLKCSPNTDGSAVMKDIVQDLPTSSDGFIYIFLGIAYSTTAMELNVNHPVYYHDGTGVRIWTGKAIPTKTSDLTNDGDGTSAFATMDDIGQLGGGTITAVKTTAGAHTTIDVTSGNASFNVPTKTSHLTNDSGFITSASLPTKTSDLENDGEDGNNPFITALELRTGIIDSEFTNDTIDFPNIGDSYTDDNPTAQWALNTIVTEIDDVYLAQQTEINDIHTDISNKADAATTLAGYGITDAYTKTQVDGKIPNTAAQHTTGISIANHSTGSIYGVSSSTTSVTGVQSSTTSVRGVKTGTGSTTTASHVKSGSNGSASTWSFSNVTVPIKNASATSIPNVTSVGTTPTLGDPIQVVSASNVTVPVAASSATTVPIKATSATTVPIKNASATSIPNVTAVGSGSYTQGTFTGGSFTQGEDVFTPATHGADSFTTNTPTVIDTTKFSGGSYSHTGFSGGSFTQGSFSGGSYTQGTFTQGGLTMAMDTTDALQLNITFTKPTHGSDSFTAATHGNDSFTAAVYGTDSFTAAKLNTGFYTAGTSASYTQGSFSGGSFTQGEDEFTPATHGADSHTHTPPTLGTAISIIGVQSGTTSVTGVQSSTTSVTGVSGSTTASKVTITESETDYGVTDVGTTPTLGTAISLTGVQSSTTTASKASGGNGTAPSWAFEDVDVPIAADADTVVPIKDASATTVPIKNSSATTVVTSATHSITDNGHSHELAISQ